MLWRQAFNEIQFRLRNIPDQNKHLSPPPPPEARCIVGGDLLELATRHRSDLQLAENERINFIGYLNQLTSEMQLADPDFKLRLQTYDSSPFGYAVSPEIIDVIHFV